MEHMRFDDDMSHFDQLQAEVGMEQRAQEEASYFAAVARIAEELHRKHPILEQAITKLLNNLYQEKDL